MTLKEEFLKKSLLHDQAAKLLRQEAKRHEKEAEQLRKDAFLIEELGNQALMAARFEDCMTYQLPIGKL